MTRLSSEFAHLATSAPDQAITAGKKCNQPTRADILSTVAPKAKAIHTTDKTDPMNHPPPSSPPSPASRPTAANPALPTARRIVTTLLAASLGMLFVSCQATSNSAAPKVENPRPVAVYDFGYDVVGSSAETPVQQSRHGPARRIAGNLSQGETPAQNAAQLSSMLSNAIVEELTKLKIPASRYSKNSSSPATGLVVQGEFLQVDEGNRLARAAIGFGAGATEVLTQVEIYDPAKSRSKPIHIYGTGSGSKPKPGAIITKNPYAHAARYVMSRNASEKDVRKLGNQIAQDIAKLQAAQLY